LFHDDSAGPKDFKKNQALSGSMINFAWMSMPFFATLIIGQYSFAMLYVLGASIALCATVLLLVSNIPEKKKRYKPAVSVFKNIRTYFSQKRLRDVYLISSGVDMWWVFIFVFVTLFMKNAGFSTAQIGLYLTLSQLPLFLFEFKTNKLVERYHYRSPFINSYTFMAFAMLVTGIVGINVFTLGLLSFTSLFIVFLEPAREMYLYEKMKLADEERMQPVYATAELVGSVTVRFTIGFLLVWANQTVAFIVMATIFTLIAFHNRTIEE
jgi:predicted MFS family arabinose efflux permease